LLRGGIHVQIDEQCVVVVVWIGCIERRRRWSRCRVIVVVFRTAFFTQICQFGKIDAGRQQLAIRALMLNLTILRCRENIQSASLEILLLTSRTTT
jgi:hypothetical protein